MGFKMKFLNVFFKMLTTLIQWLCFSLIIGMAILVFFKVFFRYVLNDPIIWSDEVIMIMLLSLTYFGAALAAHQRAHINVEILESLFSRRSDKSLRILRTIQDIATLVVLSIIVFFAFKICFFSRDQQTDILMISYFWVYIILPIGLLFMILMIIKRIFQDWKRSDLGAK